jgi:glyoxylase-like metal-dependent hydrolase (beta-lactamase superfamily II)
MKPDVTSFFDEVTCTISHVIAAPDGAAAIVDSVLDYDPRSGRTSTQSADKLIAFLRGRGLTLEWILDTHAHADHLSASGYLKDELGGRIGIGERITEVQATFKKLFNIEDGFAANGQQFDHLFGEDEHFQIGALEARAILTPGHTPACVTYVVGDAAFVGDTIFMPDFGSARTDFPGGDAATLYRSIMRILSLPPETRLFMCHDYPSGGRAAAWETTVAEERAQNKHIHDGVNEAAFVEIRKARDAALILPRLILPSVQVNIRAGRLPPPEANGLSYLKVPVNLL